MTRTILFAASLAVSAACAAGPITDKNWMYHPDIVEVRSLYEKLQKEKEAGTLKESKRVFDTAYCPYEDAVRILLRDHQGRARIYYYDGGSEDSMVTSEMFYDEAGQLRFALLHGGAVNGTKVEDRFYFSKTGTKLWENEKLLEGEGYPFVGWTAEALERDPVRAFNDPNECPEIIAVGHAVGAAEFSKLAAQRIGEFSRAGRMQGDAAIYEIVVACDKERLDATASSLGEDEIGVLEYDLALKVNSLFTSKSAIEGNRLQQWVGRCILDKYRATPGLPSGTLLHPTVETRVSFPVIMGKGRNPIFPGVLGRSATQK